MIAFVAVVLLLGAASAEWAYDHEETANKWYPLAMAAWSAEGESGCVKLAFKDAMVYYGYTLAATVTKSDAAKVIVITYQGTSTNVGQFVEELGSATFYEFFGGDQFGLDPKAKALGYFHGAFETVWITKQEAMGKAVVKIINEHPDYEVWLTGHSLGGSMATLAALYLEGTAIVPAEKIKLVTFGQPRTGNPGFAEMVEKRIPNRYRVFRTIDPVPYLPPKDLGKTLINAALKLLTVFGDNTLHWMPAIKYDSTAIIADKKDVMTPNNYVKILEDIGEDIAHPSTNLGGAHAYYFSKNIVLYGHADCDEARYNESVAHCKEDILTCTSTLLRLAELRNATEYRRRGGRLNATKNRPYRFTNAD